MNTINEKLAAIFSEDFLKANKDLDNLDAVYQAVLEKDPSITSEEFDSFIETVSKNLPDGDGELDEENLESVSGGTVLLGPIIIGFTVLAGCAIYNAIRKGRK